MKILCVNAGSSSLKFALYEMPEKKKLANGTFEKIGLEGSFYSVTKDEEKIVKQADIPTHKQAVEILLRELVELKIVSNISEIEGIGHRIVHGGDKYNKSCLVDDKVLNDIKDLSELAPLHNPAHYTAIKCVMEALPNVKNVVVFDTAFHQTMPEASYLYAVPSEWYKEYKVRKYGFHGTSHKYISKRISEILDKKDLKIISCHLGNGASICAVKDGKCIDTSMGFTPAAGLIMGSRAGDIDVSFLPYVMKKTGEDINQIANTLNKKSGLLAISELSSDFRDIVNGRSEGNEKCALAIEMFARRVVMYISYYNTLLGGADVICFAGGIGENSIEAREAIMEKLYPLGITFNNDKNNTRGQEIEISGSSSKIRCFVVPTNEELMIVEDTYSLIN